MRVNSHPSAATLQAIAQLASRMELGWHTVRMRIPDLTSQAALPAHLHVLEAVAPIEGHKDDPARPTLPSHLGLPLPRGKQPGLLPALQRSAPQGQLRTAKGRTRCRGHASRHWLPHGHRARPCHTWQTTSEVCLQEALRPAASAPCCTRTCTSAALRKPWLHGMRCPCCTLTRALPEE